jgi:alpha-L-rhamnosidase
MAGINPVEDKPGFRHIKLTPMPDYRLKYVKASYKSAVGSYESQWEIGEEGNLNFKFTIPFNATATLVLPNARLEKVKVNGILLKDTELIANETGENVLVQLCSGVYEFNYEPEVAYVKRSVENEDN